MSLPVLLLLSLLTVRCGGCDFDWEGVKNIKRTIDSNPTGFRTVFPKDYYVVHRYTKRMLCDTDPCCVFPAAVVLLESWHVLLGNLWDEHLNHSLILDLKQTLEVPGGDRSGRVLQIIYLSRRTSQANVRTSRSMARGRVLTFD
ncbi:uncharacterized protein LOC115020736 isoform X2 [Cottoperca gobio]|uniref:Uncharacterized protein LOC115020736 isoform X2 n=1 Tax=Cottoperca gobio TaxID=56716 RepID=A0A6J2RB58_COTGO|nr:uncharacterized protein LOC115020736 isoform X2 [Cottoperca gobio]